MRLVIFILYNTIIYPPFFIIISILALFNRKIRNGFIGRLHSRSILIDYFKKNNIKVIVSSSLQTQIGNLANINIAAVLNNKLYHGLNNHAYFDNLELTYSKNATQVDISKIVGLGTCWND